LRWHCPGQGLVPPDRFISVLEDTGMILPVGAWVIRAACAQLNEWDRMGLPPLRLAVNLSARQFRHLYLASMIEDTLRENEIEPGRLEIELTESLLMEDNETNRGMLQSFSRMGVRLAIDDFGTGHSSLSYLKRFNIDTLKIDKSFVQSLPASGEDLAISTAVIAMARSMQMSVVAEGVETEAQAQLLRELDCDEMQGYLLSRPLSPTDLAAWLHKRLRAEESTKMSVGRHMGDALELMTLEVAMAESAA
jgi:EAL domain-containing protein (putative c-di-GMP-specific phosphodiesterase class I)